MSYEPPPPTRPPDGPWAPYAPPHFEPPRPHPPATSGELRRQPSSVGPLLVILGLGAAILGVFAFPLQDNGDGNVRVWFAQLHDQVRVDSIRGFAPGSLARSGFSGFAQFWWSDGLLVALAVVTILAGGLAVARRPHNIRYAGAVTAVGALVVGVLHAVALSQSDFILDVYLATTRRSLFHDAGAGVWIGFAGLAAICLGALTCAAGLTTAVPTRGQASKRAAQ
jgi:hypothetical protein